MLSHFISAVTRAQSQFMLLSKHLLSPLYLIRLSTRNLSAAASLGADGHKARRPAMKHFSHQEELLRERATAAGDARQE